MPGVLRFVDGLLSLTFLVFIIGAALALWLVQSVDERGPLARQATVVIPKGAGALEVAERLERDGVVPDRRLFMLQYFLARLSSPAGAADRSSLKAGEYQFEPGASARQVLDTLVSGRGILLKVTIPEGLTSRQIVERLRAEAGLTGEIASIPPEGALLPDTYRFSRGMSRQELIERMMVDQAKALAALWAARQQGLPLKSPEEALSLASIVEKETGRNDERARVAAVFVNRLRKGMRLQSDPTIVYGLVGGQGPLGRSITRADIDSKTPYNTYQVDGLPPGPICNPGRAALQATLNPAATQDLYFVADGSGGHTFTTNLKDHNTAVANWRRIEKSRQSGAAAAPGAGSGTGTGTGTGVAEADAAATPQPAPAAAVPAGAKVPALINATKGAAAGNQPAAKKSRQTQ
jgi:UPF0755 protein